MLPPITAANPRRKSIFREVGLLDGDDATLVPFPTPGGGVVPVVAAAGRSSGKVRFTPDAEVFGGAVTNRARRERGGESEEEDELLGRGSRRIAAVRNQPGWWTGYKIGLMVLLAVVLLPVLAGSRRTFMWGAEAGVPRVDYKEWSGGAKGRNDLLVKRENSPTDVCTRWSQATAVVNGTLYVYGGRAKTDASQSSNTWNNDFLSLDLSKSWQISSPSFTGLPKPSGPPAVSLAYLWNSRSSLFLYGGEFQDSTNGNKPDYPPAFSLWEYAIGSAAWTEHPSPKTSAGTHAASAGQSVQRAAEGAGVNIASLGRGFYFGGHLDTWTTEGWSNQISRVYLKSLVEYTFPGYGNGEVADLKTAGADGVWRNVTEGGLQETSGFPERADGILVFVPGFGPEGILVGLAGGTNSTFTQMNVLDVYDISSSTWYKQATTGTAPKIRVNPCAVVAAAADGSSYNMYMFGGQDLGNDQTQYSDMWILTMPSFTWIAVDQTDQSIPYARAGHTCNIWDGQLVLVGGYVGTELSCDSPGVYVFNTSSLEWATRFTALSDREINPFSQHPNQAGSNVSAGLEGSYSYLVPSPVVKVVGGNATGGATATTPAQSASAGPLATGKPLTYTISGPTATTTSTINNTTDSSTGPNIGAIVAGVIAGVAGVGAAYFGFCAWIYRRQVALYKRHMAMAHSSPSHHGRNASINNSATGTGTFTGSSGGNNALHSAQTSLGGEGEGVGAVVGGTAAVNNSGWAGNGLPAGGGARERERYGSGAGLMPPQPRSNASSTDDLLAGQEPSFWGAHGVLLNPRRSLRVINRD
ncbi:kelch repeat protein-like protein [Phyllosticta citribraziliensis]|uniref:Kelch repeat protein-like protein n=1 Tax=Phyllosticta citribraziliensis TaxID=989973 RepID=A0ABR1LDR7_9PEZI